MCLSLQNSSDKENMDSINFYIAISMANYITVPTYILVKFKGRYNALPIRLLYQEYQDTYLFILQAKLAYI